MVTPSILGTQTFMALATEGSCPPFPGICGRQTQRHTAWCALSALGVPWCATVSGLPLLCLAGPSQWLPLMGRSGE